MKMRESKGLKATASVLLAVFLSALAVGLSGLYTLLVYYRVMDADGFRNSYVIASRMSYDIDEVVRCYQYEVMEEQGIPLSSYQQRRLAEAPSHYQSAADSNFLWVIQDENGRVLRSNLTTETPLEEFERGTNSQYSETTVWWSPWEMADIVDEFRWDTEEDRQAEISETSVLWQVRYGLRDPLTADDYYAYEEEQFSRADGWLQETLIVLAVAFVACVVLFSYLAAAAGPQPWGGRNPPQFPGLYLGRGLDSPGHHPTVHCAGASRPLFLFLPLYPGGRGGYLLFLGTGSVPADPHPPGQGEENVCHLLGAPAAQAGQVLWPLCPPGGPAFPGGDQGSGRGIAHCVV